MSPDLCPTCGRDFATPVSESAACFLQHTYPALHALFYRVWKGEHPDWNVDVESKKLVQSADSPTKPLSALEEGLWGNSNFTAKPSLKQYVVWDLVLEVVDGVPAIAWLDEPPEGDRPKLCVGEP